MWNVVTWTGRLTGLVIFGKIFSALFGNHLFYMGRDLKYPAASGYLKGEIIAGNVLHGTCTVLYVFRGIQFNYLQ